MTPYEILFLITFTPAVLLGFWRGGDFFVCSSVVFVSYGLSYFSVISPNFIWNNAVSDVFCMAIIVALCTQSHALAVGILFGVSASISICYGVVILPSAEYTSPYAHAISGMGHLQNIALAFGAADDGMGNRVRDFLRSMGSVAFGFRFHRSSSNLENRKEN